MALTIARRVRLTFGGIIVVGFLGMLIVYLGLWETRAHFNETVDYGEPVSAAAHEMEINIIGGAFGVLKYLETGDQQALGRIAKDAADFQQFKKQYERLAESGQQLSLATELDALYAKFSSLGADLVRDRDERHSLLLKIAEQADKIGHIVDKQVSDTRLPKIRLNISPDPYNPQKILLSKTLETNNAEMMAWLGMYFQTHDPKHKQRINGNIADFRDHLATFRKIGSSRQEKRWIRELQQAFDLAVELIQRAIVLHDKRQQDVQALIAVRNAMDNLLDEDIQALAAQHLKIAKKKTGEASTRTLMLVSVFAPLFILGSTFLAAFLVRRVRKGLNQAIAGTAAIGQGHLDYRLALEGNDEFTELSRQFNRMANTLQETTVSKQRLETSETNLLETVERLQQEMDWRKQAESRLAQEKERIQVTLQSIGDAVITTDTDGLVTYLNPVAEELTGWALEEAWGLPMEQVFRIFNEKTREVALNPVVTVLEKNIIVGLANHTVLVRRDNKEFSIEDSAAPIRNNIGEVIGVVLVFHDVSEKHLMSQQVLWQATHDNLTGLVNRSEFERRLEAALAVARSENNQYALLYLDLDQFKVVNDTCGHIAGDQLLRQLTSLFQDRMRETDTLARLGGDEFGVLLEHCPLEDALEVAHALRLVAQNFNFVWRDKSFKVGVSIGVVLINDHSQNAALVLSAADSACYLAKEKGRNRVWVHHLEDTDVMQRQGEMEWVSRINHALEESRFCLYAQPIVPTDQTARPGEHFEVLIRMVGDDGELVHPTEFLPAAERYGLMPNIDRWVVKTFFSKYHRIYGSDSGRTLHTCAINLSGASLNDEQFIQFVWDQFKQHNMPPNLICFEITETVAITNLIKTRYFINQLKEVGCRFALDDFGSGMSSFRYLKNLPVDYLKIDGSFVTEMLKDPINHTMVEAINNIGHVMGLQTIAEYVENQATIDVLKAIGVNYMQGYGIQHPALFQLE